MAGRRSLDHSARFDRAHRNHPRQQRRGALRRQRGRRRHQHRPEERRRRPAGRDARRSRRRLVQPAAWPSISAATNSGPWSTSFYGNAIKSDGYRVNNALDQRNGVGNLNYTTPDLTAFLTVTGDDQKLGFPGGRIGRSVDRPQRARHQPPRHRHAVRLRQPAGRQRHRRLHQDPVERRRPDRRWRRAGQEAARRVLRHCCRRLPLQPMSTAICRPGRSRRDLSIKNAMFGMPSHDPDRHRLLRCDLHSGARRVQGRAADPHLRSVAANAGRLLAANPRPVADDRFLLRRPRAEHQPERPGSSLRMPELRRLSLLATPRPSRSNSSETQYALHVGLEHRFNDVFSVFGRAARAFRTPNVDERVSSGPGLRPPPSSIRSPATSG